MFQTLKGGLSETRIEKRIVITGDCDIDHDQVSVEIKGWQKVLFWHQFSVALSMFSFLDYKKTLQVKGNWPSVVSEIRNKKRKVWWHVHHVALSLNDHFLFNLHVEKDLLTLCFVLKYKIYKHSSGWFISRFRFCAKTKHLTEQNWWNKLKTCLNRWVTPRKYIFFD